MLARATVLLSLLLVAVPSPSAQLWAQCPNDAPRSFGERYRDGLAGASVGAPIGAASAALIGLALPLLFCNAGVGESACESAWFGTLGFAMGGWLLGSTVGAALALKPDGDGAGAAAGMGVLAGGLLFAGGLGLEAATDERAFFAIAFGLWALGAFFVTPLGVAAFSKDEPCPVTSALPLGFRF